MSEKTCADAKKFSAVTHLCTLVADHAGPHTSGSASWGAHDWADKHDPRMAQWPSLRDSTPDGMAMCLICGVIRRHDEQNKPCKGPTRIGLREVADPRAPECGASWTGNFGPTLHCSREKGHEGPHTDNGDTLWGEQHDTVDNALAAYRQQKGRVTINALIAAARAEERAEAQQEIDALKHSVADALKANHVVFEHAEAAEAEVIRIKTERDEFRAVIKGLTEEVTRLSSLLAAAQNELQSAREAGEAKLGPVDGTLTSVVVRLIQSHEAMSLELADTSSLLAQQEATQGAGGQAVNIPPLPPTQEPPS
jgi:hypothetical protein